MVHGEAQKTSGDEVIRAPVATNKTSFKTSSSNQVRGTPTKASEKSEVTSDTPTRTTQPTSRPDNSPALEEIEDSKLDGLEAKLIKNPEAKLIDSLPAHGF